MGRNISILVIENESYIGKVLQYNLTLDGFQVILAPNGRDGLQKALANQPDLILLDRKMSEVDGFDALCELKNDQISCDIPVLMLIGDNAEDEISAALADGADGYILKPFDPMELGKLIMSQLENVEAFSVI